MAQITDWHTVLQNGVYSLRERETHYEGSPISYEYTLVETITGEEVSEQIRWRLAFHQRVASPILTLMGEVLFVQYTTGVSGEYHNANQEASLRFCSIANDGTLRELHSIERHRRVQSSPSSVPYPFCEKLLWFPEKNLMIAILNDDFGAPLSLLQIDVKGVGEAKSVRLSQPRSNRQWVGCRRLVNTHRIGKEHVIFHWITCKEVGSGLDSVFIIANIDGAEVWRYKAEDPMADLRMSDVDKYRWDTIAVAGEEFSIRCTPGKEWIIWTFQPGKSESELPRIDRK